MSRVLENILNEAVQLKAQGEKLLAVFDLDSTLFDLKGRHKKILTSFGHDPLLVKRFAAECEILKNVEFVAQDWGISEAVLRLGLNEEAHPLFWRELHDYWHYWFFHNQFLNEDVALPGAVEFVKLLEGLGADIMYLTGRDTGRMLEGTLKSLQQWNFPIGGEHIDVRLKPEPCMDDAQFKLNVLEKMAGFYAKIYLFENEPVNLNLIQKNLPEVGLVFLDTVHSGREQFNDELSKIAHFEATEGDFTRFLKLKK